MSVCLLQEYSERIAEIAPRKESVTDGTTRLSYLDLSLESSQLARCLISAGLRRGGRVVLCLPRIPQFIVSMISVLKADAVYVPVQADMPALRRAKILHDCEPQAIISDRTTLDRIFKEAPGSDLPRILVSITDGGVFVRDQQGGVIALERINTYSSGPVEHTNSADDVACLHYTSGTTGAPKGVMITHRNIAEYISWAVDCFGINEQDRILSTAPFHFDMALFDIYCSLMTGATLCIANEKLMLFPQLLVEFAETENITIWKGVSSLLVYLAKTGAIAPRRLPSLKKVVFSGEVLPTKHLMQWMTMFPDKAFYNAYGPTEATGISMYYRVAGIPCSPEERVPLGKPCENTEILLLDDHGRPVGPGERGEIHIKGVCVTNGYFNDPVKTAAVFVDNPLNPRQGEKIYKTGDYARLMADGNYEFLGRRDDQIKYMGYRIELPDIEQSIVSIKGVRDAGVILVESKTEDLAELVAYIELDNTVSMPNLLVELKGKLPAYMIPKHLIPIQSIPRSGSGKIDRQTLSAQHSIKPPKTS